MKDIRFRGIGPPVKRKKNGKDVETFKLIRGTEKPKDLIFKRNVKTPYQPVNRVQTFILDIFGKERKKKIFFGEKKNTTFSMFSTILYKTKP